MIELVLVCAAATIGLYLIAAVPSLLAARASRYETLTRLSDSFSSNWDVVNKHQSTTRELRSLVIFLGMQFGSPKLVRGIVTAAVSGALTRHAPAASRFTHKLDELPPDLRRALMGAILSAFEASAVSAPLTGFVFHRLMLPAPKAQPDTLAVYASEALPHSVAIAA
jgi:hypothetical protein